ncbi:MAG: hypothetical protein ACTSQP_22165, partial [Promethearchaeota archaeon]
IIRDSFRELGENNVEYLLKKLNDDIFPRLNKEKLKVILENSKNLNNFDDLLEYLYQEFNKKVNELLKHCKTIEYDKEKFIKRLKMIQTDYESKLSEQRYNEIISGKKVFKIISQPIICKYKLDKFSLEDLAKYLVSLINYLSILKDKEQGEYRIRSKLRKLKEFSFMKRSSFTRNDVFRIEIDKFQDFLKSFSSFINIILEKMSLTIIEDSEKKYFY